MGLPGFGSPALPGVAASAAASLGLRARAWIVFMVGGLALGSVAALAGDGTFSQVLLMGTGLSAGAAIMTGVWINRPARPVPWRVSWRHPPSGQHPSGPNE